MRAAIYLAALYVTVETSLFCCSKTPLFIPLLVSAANRRAAASFSSSAIFLSWWRRMMSINAWAWAARLNTNSPCYYRLSIFSTFNLSATFFLTSLPTSPRADTHTASTAAARLRLPGPVSTTKSYELFPLCAHPLYPLNAEFRRHQSPAPARYRQALLPLIPTKMGGHWLLWPQTKPLGQSCTNISSFNQRSLCWPLTNAILICPRGPVACLDIFSDSKICLPSHSFSGSCRLFLFILLQRSYSKAWPQTWTRPALLNKRRQSWIHVRRSDIIRIPAHNVGPTAADQAQTQNRRMCTL